MIVYLDSQDFSHMANPPRGAEQFWKSIEQAIGQLVDTGAIEVRYSGIHISEITHVSAEAATYSGGRADALKRLSAGKCMRMWTEVFDDEIRAALDPAHAIHPTCENDRWLEVDLTQLGNFTERLRDSLAARLKEAGANRKTRRKAAKLDLVRLLMQTPDGKRSLDTIVLRINEKYPLEQPLDREVLVAYIAGTIEKRRFLSHLEKLMLDPVNLIARIAPQHDLKLKLPALVRDQGKKLMEGMNVTTIKLSNFLQALSTEPPFDQIRKEASTLAKRALTTVRRNALRRQLAEMELAEKDQNIPDNTLDGMSVPSLDVLLGAMASHLDGLIAASQAGKSIRFYKASDAADLMHAAYVPYVDIFRCDKAWASLLGAQGKKYGTTIVGRIEDLLPAIQKKLGSSSQGSLE